MKYHSSLLKKFISINDTPENIAQKLITKTCEIEEIISRNIAESIVIGYITDCQKHPEADKLNVCQVDCGDKGQYQILCGGANVATGLFVPVALPGTYFAKANMTIEKRKMRGLESNGMICSKGELDINEDEEKHWIWNLSSDFDDISDKDKGTPLSQKYPRLNSYVFDVDNKGLTNRPDLTGHFGAAVELNAIYSRQEKSISYNKISDRIKQFQNTNILETLENATKSKRNVVGKTDGVNSYILLEINNIKTKQTSFFTRLQMLDMGYNPRNNRVDFSNLFMLITGQPIHFFDADKVNGDIIVRNAKDGEEFTDLFETKHSLKSTDIVIADKSKILALAGVVGGLESGISETTENILVEIANFDPVSVRKTGTRLSLRTDAELRYEKNINPRWSMYCLLLFLEELKYYSKDLGSGNVDGVSYYISPKIGTSKIKEIPIDLDIIEKAIFGENNKIKKFKDEAKQILVGLGFEVKENKENKENKNKISIYSPIWRSPDDINILEDITEEIIRIYGYENIDGLPVLSDIQNTPYTPFVKLCRKIEEIMIDVLHSDQTETYPRVSEKIIKQFNKTSDNFYSLQNPVNPETPYMRDSMIYNLLGYASKNSKFFDEFKIFDIGKIRHKNNNKKNKDKGIYAHEIVEEKYELGVLLYKKTINQRSDDPILDAKNIINTILNSFGIQINIDYKNSENNSFHPKKQTFLLVNGVEIGFIGSIHPLILKDQKIPENSGLTYISIYLGELLKLVDTEKQKDHHYETLQDQIIWRDLCFVVDNNSTFENLLNNIKSVPEIREIEVFDVYNGKNLGENKKSISFRFKILGDGNMTTEQINNIMNKLIEIGQKNGANLRA